MERCEEAFSDAKRSFDEVSQNFPRKTYDEFIAYGKAVLQPAVDY